MIETTQSADPQMTTEKFYPARAIEEFEPALKNPAVALCNEAWGKIFRTTLKLNKNIYTAKRCAAAGYRLSMPSLNGPQEIRDFIACVGYGVLLGAIKPDTATKLVYTAQVALSALPKDSKPSKRSKSNKTKPITHPGASKMLNPATPAALAVNSSIQKD